MSAYQRCMVSCRFVYAVIIRCVFFFFSSRRRHTRCSRDWSSDVCSSDLAALNERADKRGARALAGAILGLLLLGSGILALLGIAYAPAITTVLAKGFDEPRRQLTISLVRILFPMTGLMVISAWCLGILNTHRRFSWAPAWCRSQA